MMKRCPQCAEEIRAEAKVCRYCGYSYTAVEGQRHRFALILVTGVILLFGGLLWLDQGGAGKLGEMAAEAEFEANQ